MLSLFGRRGAALVLFWVAFLPCSWAWRRDFVARTSNKLDNNNWMVAPTRRSVFLRLRGGGNDDDDGKEFYDSNTSGFGPMINTGGFLSHIFVMSPYCVEDDENDNVDTGIRVLKKYLTSTKFNILFDDRMWTEENVERPEDVDEENDVEAILRRIVLVSKAIVEINNGRSIPICVCSRDKRDDYFKLIGIREVEDDAGRFYTIYCLTVLDSFGDKEKKLLEELKELVGSELGYIGHMLSPPPSTAEEFLANVKETKEASSSSQLNEKIGYFAGDEMSVKEWVTKLRQTGGSMVSKPELERYVFLGTSFADIKETLADGDDDVEEIEPTPEFLKTFYQGEIWEYPNWEFHATKEYLFVQFGEDRGAVLQWKEPLDVDPSSLAVDGGVVTNVIENEGETFFL